MGDINNTIRIGGSAELPVSITIVCQDFGKEEKCNQCHSRFVCWTNAMMMFTKIIYVSTHRDVMTGTEKFSVEVNVSSNIDTNMLGKKITMRSNRDLLIVNGTITKVDVMVASKDTMTVVLSGEINPNSYRKINGD